MKQHATTRNTAGVSRRSFLLGAGGIASGFALAGCAPIGSSSKRPETITFYVSKPEVIGYFDDLIAQFHDSQSSVRVIRDSTSNMSANFVRNAPPDLGCWNYNFSVVPFVEHGALTDLSDLEQADTINPDLWPLMEQTADYPGRKSALPYSVMSASVIYNKQLFADNGVDVPTTWTELAAVCDKLTAAGVTPFYNTYKDTWTIAQGMFDYSIGGALDVPATFASLQREGTSVGKDSKVSFEKDFAMPMQRMTQLAKWSNKDAASRGYGDGNLAFAQGKAAMYMQGPWALGEIAKTTKNMDLGTFPLPVTDDPDDRKVRVNVDLALWIPEQSKKQEAARDFLTFLMQPKVNDKYNADNNGFGVRKDAPPASNPALAGMQSFYDSAAFSLGASQLIPAEIPVANYAQAIALGGDPARQLRTLDADWARLALRSA
ncbi:ABC transporter substrate-binding protein [Curtobacterium sp. ZW137]|uniref:ABC transporter substrate-binding protein n=1 Tax=Curtobacterium sp. ZW137 TaxID=2485104 RepID=UPI000F4CDEBC|nr:extracellular solute-binding protein [Curtobacterium sp. ZW137]ROP60943.1 carbohydrate ABC transporter substrate-binding protein (CUT1 family) [Curtobacterium sp. ZW137]